MRLQHNISPPAPGRGGSRKRKRGIDETGTPVNIQTPPPPGTGNSSSASFTTFKIEPRDNNDLVHSQYHVNGRHSAASRSPTPPPRPNAAEDDEGYTSSASDAIPAHLKEHLEPSTNLILGRSPDMVMYLLMKAKHKYALEQHEYLLEELRVARAELKKEKEEKEIAVDHVLRDLFGSEAESFIAPISMPASMIEKPVVPASSPSQMTNGHRAET